MATRAIALTLDGHRPIALEVPAMPAWGREFEFENAGLQHSAEEQLQQQLDTEENELAGLLNMVRGFMGNIDDMIPDAEIARSIFPALELMEQGWTPWALRSAALKATVQVSPNSTQREQIAAIINTGDRINALLNQTRELLEAMALIDQHPRDARKLDAVMQQRVSKLAMRRMRAYYEPDPQEEALIRHYANATKLTLVPPDNVE